MTSWPAAPAWLVLAAVLLAGCAARRPAPPSGAQCPGLASLPPADAICARDEGVRSLRARFRAAVQTPDASRTAEGVLVFRAPGALRVKLFTLAGLTVYDAVWVGDEQRVRGVVRQPLAGTVEEFDLGPGEVLGSTEGDLALVLWALWRPRCAAPPSPGGESDGAAHFLLDPATARALERQVTVASGAVQHELLLRADAGGGPGDRVVARYADYECRAQPPLPLRISVEAPARGWRAEVTILEQARNVSLDDGLFEIGEGASGHGGG
ncbi:MAG: hypothetical protein AB1689_11375 [Thermodesulfobacteriota bacterium]